MKILFFVFVIAVGVWATAPLVLIEMRNSRGLYAWPKWIQALICLADGIPLSRVGRHASNEDCLAALMASLSREEWNEERR